MKFILVYLAIFSGQINTMVERPIVHLQPHKNLIEIGFGGKTLQLLNAPPIVQLPPTPPESDPEGNPWIIYIKNVGPTMVTIVDRGVFSIPIRVGGSVRIYANGSAYSWKP
jgi:hypothetical protein